MSAALADYHKTLMGGGAYRLEVTDFQDMDLVIPAEDLPRYEVLARGHNTRETSTWLAEREHNARRIFEHINTVPLLFDNQPVDKIGTSEEYGAGLTLSIVKAANNLAMDCPSGSERAALAVALMLQEQFGDQRKIVVACCEKFDRQIPYYCRMHGLEYVNVQQPRFASRYQGATEAFCAFSVFQDASEKRYWDISLDKLTIWDERLEVMRPIGKMTTNEYVKVQNSHNPNALLFGRFDGKKVVAIIHPHKLFGVAPMGIRQQFLADALTNKPQNKVIIVDGVRGVGKTLLATAAAFQLRQDGEFSRIFYFRNNIEMAEKEGFLPGTQEQKCDHYFKAIYQAIARVAEIRGKDEGYKKAMTLDPVAIGRQLARTENSQFQMVVDTINDERGTTYDNAVVIIDEAQNLKPYQLQSMIGGMGHDSLLVILGNVSQIDADLNGYHNGLAQAMSNLRGAPNVYQLRLLESNMVKRGVIASTVAEYWPYA